MEETNIMLLNRQIRKLLEQLDTLNPESDEYKKVEDAVTKLIDRATELDRLSIDEEGKANSLAFEKLKQREDSAMEALKLDRDRKDSIVRNILTGAGIIIPSLLTVWGTVKSLKFEETGTVTTIMGRGFLNKLLPRK